MDHFSHRPHRRLVAYETSFGKTLTTSAKRTAAYATTEPNLSAAPPPIYLLQAARDLVANVGSNVAVAAAPHPVHFAKESGANL